MALKVTITGVGVGLSSSSEHEIPTTIKNKIAEKLNRDFIIIYFRVKKKIKKHNFQILLWFNKKDNKFTLLFLVI
ncbi:hypothetical protein D3C84_1007950 [compost metagenome]